MNSKRTFKSNYPLSTYERQLHRKQKREFYREEGGEEESEPCPLGACFFKASLKCQASLRILQDSVHASLNFQATGTVTGVGMGVGMESRMSTIGGKSCSPDS